MEQIELIISCVIKIAYRTKGGVVERSYSSALHLNDHHQVVDTQTCYRIYADAGFGRDHFNEGMIGVYNTADGSLPHKNEGEEQEWYHRIKPHSFGRILMYKGFRRRARYFLAVFSGRFNPFTARKRPSAQAWPKEKAPIRLRATHSKERTK